MGLPESPSIKLQARASCVRSKRLRTTEIDAGASSGRQEAVGIISIFSMLAKRSLFDHWNFDFAAPFLKGSVRPSTPVRVCQRSRQRCQRNLEFDSRATEPCKELNAREAGE